MAARIRCAARRARDGGRGQAGADTAAADGLDGYRESLWLTSLTYLTDACAAVGDEATAALVYPELEPLGGANVMIGHLVSCYGAADRYLGDARCDTRRSPTGRSGTSSARWNSTGAWAPRPGWPTPRTSTDACCSPGGVATATRRGRCSARPRRWPSASACRHCWPDHRSRHHRAGGSGPARWAVSPRGADPRPGRPGAQQPGDRSGAHDQRAHRRQPREQHPAQDRLLQPHRGRLLRTPAPARAGLSHTAARLRTRTRSGTAQGSRSRSSAGL